MNAPETGFESRVPPVATSAEQLLTGLQVAHSGHNESCTACGERLREGQTVSVYASQLRESVILTLFVYTAGSVGPVSSRRSGLLSYSRVRP